MENKKMQMSNQNQNHKSLRSRRSLTALIFAQTIIVVVLAPKSQTIHKSLYSNNLKITKASK